MVCDYYVESELVVEYQDKTRRLCTVYTNRKVEKYYVSIPLDYDSDDDDETEYKKYEAEVERKIKDNTYNKMLFENGEWIKESYRKKYENNLLKLFPDINKILKLYKKHTACKRN